MTHWKTDENRSKMHKHRNKNMMTKKEERAFFGHGFGGPSQVNTSAVDGWFE